MASAPTRLAARDHDMSGYEFARGYNFFERATFEQVLALGQLLAQESAKRVRAEARVQELEAALRLVEGWVRRGEGTEADAAEAMDAALNSQATEETT